MLAIVGYKDGGDLPYEDIRSWRVQGNVLILSLSRREHIIVPLDSFTSAEIREEK